MSPVHPIFSIPLPLSQHSPHHLILTIILSSPSMYRTSFLLHLTLMTTVWLTSHLRPLYEDMQWLFISPDHDLSKYRIGIQHLPKPGIISLSWLSYVTQCSITSALIKPVSLGSHIHHYPEVTCSFLLANSFFSIWLNLAYSSWPTSSIKSHVPPSLIAPACTDLLCL